MVKLLQVIQPKPLYVTLRDESHDQCRSRVDESLLNQIFGTDVLKTVEFRFELNPFLIFIT